MQNMEYKFVELLSLQFMASSEDIVRLQASYRYNAARARLALAQARLADITQLVSAQTGPGACCSQRLLSCACLAG